MTEPRFPFGPRALPRDEEIFNQDEEAKGLYIRSASFELVHFFIALRCAKCDRTFSKVRLPQIALCGHFVCDDCFNKFTPYVCEDKKHEKRKTTQRDQFIEATLLREFFKQHEEPGYKCWLCTEVHPKNNTVVHELTTPDGSLLKQYICVWCLSKPRELTLRQRLAGVSQKFRLIIDGDHTNQGRDKSKITADYCELRDLGCAFLQCCMCAQQFEKEYKMEHLPCGHVIHENCRDLPSRNGQDHCNFCHGRGIALPRDMTREPTSFILTDGFAPARHYRFFRCDGFCKMLHADYDGNKIQYRYHLFRKKNVCVWCMAEHKMGRRGM